MAANVEIVRVFGGWRTAASFKRISEYFNGRENTGAEIVVRSQPGEREGYYFLVRMKNPGAATDARIVLDVVTPDSHRPRTFTFLTALPAGKAVFNFGLTGADWPRRSVEAVAWKIDVFDASNELLASEKSYLWEKPPGE